MPRFLPSFAVFGALTPDGRVLFATRFVRLFAYGMLSLVLVLYLGAVGVSEDRIGLLLTLTLVGDTAVSLWLTTRADRFGRRRTLVAGALLMILASLVFALTSDFWLLLLAATVGVISPSGNEVGPFLAVEQAALSQAVAHERRTETLAWYGLAGSVATALGSLAAGYVSEAFQAHGHTGAAGYRPVVLAYGAIGLLLAAAFARLSPAVEVHTEQPAPRARMGLHRSRGVVFRLAGLFALDAFGGGFVIQSLVAYWFQLRFGADPAALGGIFFGANLLAGLSGLAAPWVARRIGLVRTMVWTHLPSNILLMVVPLMPSASLGIAVLLLRFSISQMDVPTRQSYTLAVVEPDERSAASGVAGVARSVGAALSPVLAGVLLATPALTSVPFFVSGGVKIVYDLLLYRNFVAVRPPEEQATPSPAR
jgi:MFS family permease